MGKITEIRWHGRGGQGAKTASEFVALVALSRGKYCQAFPEYGPERSGAPVKGYTRISDGPIRIHCAIDFPDTVVVLDETLLDVVDVCEGLKENGTVVVNSPLDPAEIRGKLKLEGRKVFTVDATKISLDEIGRPIPNTPMIGALIRATVAVDIEDALGYVEKKFGEKFKADIVEGNKRAIRRAYEETRSE